MDGRKTTEAGLDRASVQTIFQKAFQNWQDVTCTYISFAFKGLDTGCVYGRMLTGWCPEEQRFYQVRARKEYASP